MVAGIGAGELFALVRDARALQQRPRSIVISGPGAAALAARLAAGGDAAAVRAGVSVDPDGVAAVVIVLDSAPGPEEVSVLRRADGAEAPLLVIRTAGFSGPVPYVLPTSVIDLVADEDAITPLVDALVSVLAEEDAIVLARLLPVLRAAVVRRTIARTAVQNAVLAASPWVREAHLPLITLAQGQMLLRLGIAEGAALPGETKDFALRAGPPLASAVATGLALRALARRLPVRGPLVRAAVAYAGTRGIAALRARLP